MRELNALRNRVIILEEYCLNLVGGLPPGYSPLDGGEIPIPSNAPTQTSLGHKPNGVTVSGFEAHTDAALSALECSD